jgi:hypothetical protein
MLRGFSARFILMTALLQARVTHAEAPLRLPPGTRETPDGSFVSGRGLRDSTDFIAKELVRRGIAVQQIGPYRIRGTEITRFVSESKTTPWLAIHVLRTGGKTAIFFVARPKA